MGGSAVGVSMYLKEHPSEKISNGDAAISGAISGAVAGLIAAVVGLALSFLTTTAVMGALRQVPPEMRPMVKAMVAGGGVLGIVVGPLLYAAFGALGGFLSMQLFFKDRLRND
jgi:MFS family permease